MGQPEVASFGGTNTRNGVEGTGTPVPQGIGMADQGIHAVAVSGVRKGGGVDKGSILDNQRNADVRENLASDQILLIFIGNDIARSFANQNIEAGDAKGMVMIEH